MSTGTASFLSGLILMLMSVTVSAFSKRPETAWNYYHFDGHAFIAGQPTEVSPFLAIRDQVQPVVLSRPDKIEAVALPADKGAIAGICYIQSSGGKLSGGRGYAPSPRLPITISSGNRVVTRVNCDENGYFVVIVAEGTYDVGNGIFKAEVTVKKGSTILVPLRTGKRMVD